MGTMLGNEQEVGINTVLVGLQRGSRRRMRKAEKAQRGETERWLLIGGRRGMARMYQMEDALRMETTDGRRVQPCAAERRSATDFATFIRRAVVNTCSLSSTRRPARRR